MADRITILGVEVAAPAAEHVVMIQGNPYLTVEGRLALLRRVLVAKGHKETDYSIIPHPPVISADGRLVGVSVVVELPWGRYGGTSGVNTAETQRNGDPTLAARSPFEVAETSAVGRALGLAGLDPYGRVESAAGMRKAGVDEPAPPRAPRSASAAPTSGGGGFSLPVPEPNDGAGGYVCQECHAPIRDSRNYTAAQLAAISLRKAGGIYCFDHRMAREGAGAA